MSALTHKPYKEGLFSREYKGGITRVMDEETLDMVRVRVANAIRARFDRETFHVALLDDGFTGEEVDEFQKVAQEHGFKLHAVRAENLGDFDQSQVIFRATQDVKPTVAEDNGGSHDETRQSGDVDLGQVFDTGKKA